MSDVSVNLIHYFNISLYYKKRKETSNYFTESYYCWCFIKNSIIIGLEK